jgi:hypothetical protein
MLPGDLNPHTQLLGLILVQKHEDSLKELLPARSMRQTLARALARAISAIREDRSEIKSQLITLSDANRALEARVLELESRLAVASITPQ